MTNAIKCFFGFHKPNGDWFLKWSNKKYYCKCEVCDKTVWHK